MSDKAVIRTPLLENSSSWEPAAEVYGKDRLSWEKEVATTHQVMP